MPALTSLGTSSAVIAGRDYLVFSAAFDETNDIPANTVLFQDDWGAPYGLRGYTDGGVSMSLAIRRGEIRVDQLFDPVMRPITSRDIMMSCDLAELTPANLQLTTGQGTITAVAAVSGTKGYTDLDFDATFTDSYETWGYDIRKQDGNPFRILLWKGLATGSPAPRFSPDKAAVAQLQVTALIDDGGATTRIMKVRSVTPALP